MPSSSPGALTEVFFLLCQCHINPHEYPLRDTRLSLHITARTPHTRQFTNMLRYYVFLFSLISYTLLAPCAATCVSGSRTASSLIREQFDRFVLLQRRGPPKPFLMPFYTSYISALDAFIADLGFCSQSFGPCCLEQREIDNFHAIHDRSLVDSQIANLRIIDPKLFFLPQDVISDDDLPVLTTAQQTEVDTMWKVTQEALEDTPDSYIAVWSVLPEGLNMLHDPRQPETCSEFEKYKSSVPVSKLITSVDLIHKVAAIALHGQYLGVSRTDAVQLLFHATAFIFNGIRCEKKQNEDLMVPPTFFPFYASKIRMLLAQSSVSYTSIPEIPTAAVQLYLGDTLRVLSSYKSWGRVEHIVTNGILTDKRSIKTDLFSASKAGQILGYMLDNVAMSDAERTNVQAKKNENDVAALLTSIGLSGASLLLSYTNYDTPLYLVPSNDLTFVYRQVTCTVDLFHPYPVDPATALSECCADLCDQTSLLQTLTPPLTKSQCCTHCNEAQCDVEDPSNPLSALDEVHLIPYYDPGSEVVNI